jgi:hypothetical protein
MAHLVPHDWLQPDWPAPAHVHALCTTRNGGVSAPPYDSFNLGRLVGDAPQAVAANWAALGAALGAAGDPVRLVYLRQVHGTVVQPLDADTPDGADADACTTTTPGVACSVMAADCLPVLFTNRAGTRVAAAHAGWRGLAAGVLEAALESFKAEALTDKAQGAIQNDDESGTPQDLMAWLGPCIGPQVFEVGPEVREAFCAHDARAQACFQPQGNAGKWLADLAGLAHQRLRAQGLTAIYGNDSSPGWCTVGNPSRFFSHRRDSAVLGTSGRMAACIWISS